MRRESPGFRIVDSFQTNWSEERMNMQPMRRDISMIAILAGLLFASGRVDAQELKQPVDKTLQAAGWPIQITYYESPGDKESPVVILVPGAEGYEDSRTRKVWDGLAKALQKEKYAVVTADLRKHGDSLPLVDDDKKARLTRLAANDYLLMAGADMEAIKEFLMQEHENQKLNIRKTGIAAAGSSCLVVSAFAAADWLKPPWNDAPAAAFKTPRGQDVRAILMLSPKSTVRGINLAQTMKVIADPIKGVAIHIWYNPKNRSEVAAAKKIFRFVELKKEDPEEPRKLNEGPPDKKYTAEGLLEDRAAPVMEKNIREFFDKFVKARPEEWRTRKSKLQQ